MSAQACHSLPGNIRSRTGRRRAEPVGSYSKKLDSNHVPTKRRELKPYSPKIINAKKEPRNNRDDLKEIRLNHVKR